MKLAMIGLGRMGANMAERLLRGGHEVVVFDLSPEAVKTMEGKGAIAATSLEEVVELLEPPRIAWVMVPAGEATEKTIKAIAKTFQPGDTVIDGGNSFYKDTVRRGEALAKIWVELIDVGTSGGVWGLAEGYSMMVGSSEEGIKGIMPILKTLAPTSKSPESSPGWGRVGPSGAGHFVKMVHNGIEYGMMQAYAEGFELMERKEEFALDLGEVSRIWQDGSVIRSWLLDLTAEALKEDPELKGIAPFVPDSGEGRWTVMEGVELGVSLPVITLALQNRFKSQDDDSYGDKLLSAMRNKFGGHEIKKS